MDAVSGGYDPQSASSSRASPSVAPITTPSGRRIQPKEGRHALKRKAVDESFDDNKVPGSNSVSDQAEEHSKRVKLDNEAEAPVFAEKTKTTTHRTFTLLKENTPEQRLDIQLPYETFLELDQAFSELKSAEGISEDQMYPSLGCNSLTQTAAVVTCPGNMHERAAGWIERKIINYAEEIDAHECGSTTQSFGRGDYTRSRNEPDGGFKTRLRANKLMIAIEVGTSETYDKLLDDKDMWINGNGVNVVILMCFEQSPPFRNPDTRYTNIAGVDAELETVAQSIAETVEANIGIDYYGPLEYRDHTWVDSHETFHLIQEGYALDSVDLPGTLNLRISDFYPHDEWHAANIEDNDVPFDSIEFLDSVRDSMGVFAELRLEFYLKDKLGLY
ncbi:hypothetical protein V1517DRAFT_363460 [Lipomyces orientalis]|uniref:Uncharacterized protein n=1 Tax=Lipomyces orientalis TaxID=1233043 RepID=A0ACC3TJ42_9ASCO